MQLAAPRVQSWTQLYIVTFFIRNSNFSRRDSIVAMVSRVDLLVWLVLVLTLMSVISYFGMRGMCKWTQGDSIPIGLLKTLVNISLGGVPGLVLSAALPENCAPLAPYERPY